MADLSPHTIASLDSGTVLLEQIARTPTTAEFAMEQKCCPRVYLKIVETS